MCVCVCEEYEDCMIDALTRNGDRSNCSLIHRTINRNTDHYITSIRVDPREGLGHYQGAGDSGSGISDPGGLRHDKCGPSNGGHTTAIEGKD